MWKSVFILSALGFVSARDNKFINFGGFVCPRDEKALEKCLRDSLNGIIPQLSTGLPQYGVPSCEPLIIPALSIQISTGIISVTSSFSNVTVRGPSTMQMESVVINSKEHQAIIKLFIPKLRLKGHYSLDGQFSVLPVNGEGQFTSEYGNIDAVVTIQLGREHRSNDVDALSCEDLQVKFHIGSASMMLNNLFGGNNELGNTMNTFLNDNWLKLAGELQVPMEKALRDFLKPIAKQVFSTMNADDILLR